MLSLDLPTRIGLLANLPLQFLEAVNIVMIHITFISSLGLYRLYDCAIYLTFYSYWTLAGHTNNAFADLHLLLPLEQMQCGSGIDDINGNVYKVERGVCF